MMRINNVKVNDIKDQKTFSSTLSIQHEFLINPRLSTVKIPLVEMAKNWRIVREFSS